MPTGARKLIVEAIDSASTVFPFRMSIFSRSVTPIKNAPAPQTSNTSVSAGLVPIGRNV